MGKIIINQPAAPSVTFKYGPYDVTDYLIWIAALKASVQAGSELEHSITGTQIIFTEIR